MTVIYIGNPFVGEVVGKVNFEQIKKGAYYRLLSSVSPKPSIPFMRDTIFEAYVPTVGLDHNGFIVYGVVYNDVSGQFTVDMKSEVDNMNVGDLVYSMVNHPLFGGYTVSCVVYEFVGEPELPITIVVPPEPPVVVPPEPPVVVPPIPQAISFIQGAVGIVGFSAVVGAIYLIYKRLKKK